MPEFQKLIQLTRHTPAPRQSEATQEEPQPRAARNGLLARAYGLASATVGTVAGITPHVLHHIGPIAGAAVLTGTEGSVLFGVIGFVLTLPLLFRLKKRFNSWAGPGVALTLFAVMFTISTLWIGPAIRGDNGGDGAAPVDPHHASISSPASSGGLVHANDVALLSTKERA